MMGEIISTIFNIDDLYRLKEVKADGVIIADDYHGTRLAKAFSLADIKKISTICAELKLKLFIKMNRIYLDKELKKAEEYLNFLSELKITGIFYNDLAIYGLAKKLNLHNKLVYDPDTIVTNHFDVNYHLNKGIYGVILSKEITKEEMIDIAKNSLGRVGIIIHGYLNMSYSRRKLMENYFTFINKEVDIDNRRDLYIVEETREGKMPILEDDHGTAIFTDYVQESFDEIKELENAGVSLFLVDGIFLETDCIMEAIKGYRLILDGHTFDKNGYYERYANLPLSTGYMEKATNLVK